MKKLLIALLLLIPNFALAADDPANGQRGWFWYQDPYEEVKEKPPEPATPAPASVFAPPSTLAEAQKLLKELKEAAIWQPTPANLNRYMRLQWMMMEKAEAFSDQWQRQVITEPSLDYSQIAPTEASAITMRRQTELQDKRVDLQKVSQKYGLFFVFRSDCPYCHREAEILEQFSLIYGMTILPVSLDNKGLPQYPNPKPGSVLTGKIEIPKVPALFLVEPNQQQILPISYGLVSAEEIVRRIGQMTQEEKKP